MNTTQTVADDRLPEVTIQAVARGFFREADSYGFRPPDYVRFMSALLDIANSRIAVTPRRDPTHAAAPPPVREIASSSDRLVILPFEYDRDMATVDGWLEDPSGRHFLPLRAGGPPGLEDLARDPRSVIGMVTLPDGLPIGVTAYLDYDPLQRRAELRKLIGDPAMRGRGYGKAATRLWLRYGFETLNLHKIYLSTLNTNLRNIRLNEGLGFRLEGILRDELFIDGRYHDVLRMAIRSSDGNF